MDANGIGYSRASESLSHSPDIYGSTYVTRGYVERAVARSCGVDPTRIRCSARAV